MAVIYEANFTYLDGQKLMKDIYHRVIQELPGLSIPSYLPNNCREPIKQILQRHFVTNVSPITREAARGFIRQINPKQLKATEEGKKFLNDLLQSRAATGFFADGSFH